MSLFYHFSIQAEACFSENRLQDILLPLKRISDGENQLNQDGTSARLLARQELSGIDLQLAVAQVSIEESPKACPRHQGCDRAALIGD